MENRFRKKIALFIALILISACDKFEMRGFIRSYESADERFRQSAIWNSDHPEREIIISENEYSIYAMGDSHVGGTNNLDAFIADGIASNALALVMVGDITTGHAEDYAVLNDHIPDPNFIESFLIVGNHDLYFGGWKQFYSLYGASTYKFTIITPQAKDLFICLDTGSGTLGSEQLEWLKNTLETERANYRHCILFTHNNLFRNRHTTSTNPLVEELHIMLDLSIKYSINMVVTGHDHLRNVESFGGTTYITMDALLDDYDDAGYLKLNFDHSEIKFEFINI